MSEEGREKEREQERARLSRGRERGREGGVSNVREGAAVVNVWMSEREREGKLGEVSHPCSDW